MPARITITIIIVIIIVVVVISTAVAIAIALNPLTLVVGPHPEHLFCPSDRVIWS
jgi:hypothetical protein